MSLTKNFVFFGQRYDNTEVDTEIARLNSLIKAKDTTIEENNTTIAALTAKITELLDANKAFEEQLKDIADKETPTTANDSFDKVSNKWKNEEFYIEEEVYKHIVLHDRGLNYTPYDKNETNQVDYLEIVKKRESLRDVCNEYYNFTARKPEERSYENFLECFNSTPVAYALYYDKGYTGTPLVKKR